MDPVMERAREMAISAYPTLYAALLRQTAEMDEEESDDA